MAATLHHYQTGDVITNIGKPIGNTKLYVLNEAGALQPAGGVGEFT